MWWRESGTTQTNYVSYGEHKCVCVCISSSDAVAVSEELVQADSACSCGQWNESICLMLEHPHEHVSLAGTDQAQAGQILQGGLSAG